MHRYSWLSLDVRIVFLFTDDRCTSDTWRDSGPMLPDDDSTLFHLESTNPNYEHDTLEAQEQDPYIGQYDPFMGQDDEQSELSFSSAFGTPNLNNNPSFGHHRETTV